MRLITRLIVGASITIGILIALEGSASLATGIFVVAILAASAIVGIVHKRSTERTNPKTGVRASSRRRQPNP